MFTLLRTLRFVFYSVSLAGLEGCAGGGDLAHSDQASCCETSDIPAVVGQWQGGEITRDDVLSQVGRHLRRLDIQYRLERFEMLSRVVDAMAEDAVLTRAQQEGGFASREALLQAKIYEILPDPTQDEFEHAFARLQKQMPDAQRALATPKLTAMLRQQRAEEARAAYLQQLFVKYQVDISLPFPQLPRVDVDVHREDPAMGPALAPVTIVQYGGFQCYYCCRSFLTLNKLRERYPQGVRLVFKDFLPSHQPNSVEVAVAAHCAEAQDKYDVYSASLRDVQGQVDRSGLDALARQHGLDQETWKTCMRDPKWEEHIRADTREGYSLGVTSTPTFFINGLMMVGAQDFKRFNTLVRQEQDRLAPPQGGAD